MKLSDYLSNYSISAADFAKDIGVRVQTVNRYRNGERIPERKTMQKIIAVTKGIVTANSFYSPAKDVAASESGRG